MDDLVLREATEGIAILTLNRPNKLNALSYALLDRLFVLLNQLEEDASVRAVVLTGAGERAFSAGGDINEFSSSVGRGVEEADRHFVRRGQAVTARIEAFPKPIIVAVNGLAFGGGCEITEAAHLSIAADTAEFAKPEVKLGMPPTFGGTQRLSRLAGRKRALDLLLSGRTFTAQAALEMGLINRVVAKDSVMDEAMRLAKEITQHSPIAVSSIISAVTRGLNTSIAEGLAIEAAEFRRMVLSADLEEGLSAWKERRTPRYRGI